MDFGIIIAGVVTLIVSLFSVLLTMPNLIETLRTRKILGTDMNKFSKPEIPEMGGIGVMIGVSFGVVAAIASSTYLKVFSLDLTLLLAAFATVFLVGFLGIIDDLLGWRKGLSHWQHALLPLFAALPLMAVKINNPPLQLPILGALPEQFFLPFLGAVSFGTVYSLLIVPAGVTGASNATNILAGLNGLEAGLGALIAGTMLFIAVMFGKPEAVVILAAMLGSLIAFLHYNWFPARVFGGDSLTLMIGGSIAAASVVGDMEKTGVLLLALFFVELAFKSSKGMKSHSFGAPQKNGLLKPDSRGGSLVHWILRRKQMNESQLVLTILGMQLAVCIAVLIFFFFGWLR